MVVLPFLKTDRKLDRWQTDRHGWGCFSTVIYRPVTAMLLLVQKNINRNGSPLQSEAHLSSAGCCAGCPCDDFMLTSRNGPLPMASIRTELCMSVTAIWLW